MGHLGQVYQSQSPMETNWRHLSMFTIMDFMYHIPYAWLQNHFGIVWDQDVLTDSVTDREETELNVSSILRRDGLCLADCLCLSSDTIFFLNVVISAIHINVSPNIIKTGQTQLVCDFPIIVVIPEMVPIRKKLNVIADYYSFVLRNMCLLTSALKFVPKMQNLQKTFI